LLTDYQVVVIGVTDAEAKAWVADAKLVRTKDGLETDARTLAAQIGLAKAMKEYSLTRMITFHRSIARASRFVDEGRRDSLPAVIEKLRPASRPSGRLWARHVSGETPASKRASLVKELGELPSGVRGLISNCACLGEGVDVPALDGIAFIDPKGSVVDIIQAVGRVIRRSPDKKIGTIIIPVFVDESEDADHALESSAFQPVWQVLKALRAHDRRLADELDQLRTSLGRQATPGQRIQLPANVVLDVPRLLLKNFEQAFYVRAVMAAAEKPPLTVEQILAWADEHRARTGEWPKYTSGPISGTTETWSIVNAALYLGKRGLRGGSSLSSLLAGYGRKRNPMDLPDLTEAQILAWADAYRNENGRWPNAKSGPVAGSTETWAGVSWALLSGRRGLRQQSIANLLASHRQKRNAKALPPLSLPQILAWADQHRAARKKWPKRNSGAIKGTEERWSYVDAALKQGNRGLPGGSSLSQLLTERRGVRPGRFLPTLSMKMVLAWADRHHRQYGEWPLSTSGNIPGTVETWDAISRAVARGQRGLPGSKTLPQLLAECRGVPNKQALPKLTVALILSHCDRYKRETGNWPTRKSGCVPGNSNEKWKRIDEALSKGLRGLPGGSSLAQLLDEHRRGKE
jgi:hypothetical protein